MQEMEPPPLLATRLFPHQRQALAWMCGRENRGALPPFWEALAVPGGGEGLAYANQVCGCGWVEGSLRERVCGRASG